LTYVVHSSFLQLSRLHNGIVKLRSPLLVLLAGSTVLLAGSDKLRASEAGTAVADSESFGFIVQFRADSSAPATSVSSKLLAGSLALRSRSKVRATRDIGPGLQAIDLVPDDTGRTPADVLRALQLDPRVDFAVPDERRYIQAIPNDPLFVQQWYLQAAQPAAIDAVQAWDITSGDADVVVAVLDTGIRFEHSDLGRVANGGRLLPGYDFVSGESSGTFLVANDHDGRDADPSDPGDWLTSADKNQAIFANCDTSNSSWHGTRVAGMIAAKTNNNNGIAGGSWGSLLLPVRVLGKCGGRDSDILAGMRWAAGLPVPGVPDNPNPAKILNLSLGSVGSCSAAYSQLLAELNGRGVLVVASAGNEGGEVSAPANCPGVVAVAGLRNIGTKVGFSNLGPAIALGAPGGNCVNATGQACLFSLDTTSNTGTTAPEADYFTDQFSPNFGTSFAAPLVASVAALMASANRNLGTVQLRNRLREGATPYPPAAGGIPACVAPDASPAPQISECACTTDVCGAGMTNAAGAVRAALRPVVAIAAPLTTSPGQNVTLDASRSGAACGRSIAQYQWTVLSAPGAPPAILGANTAVATVVAPSSGALVLGLTITDDRGLTDAATVTVGAQFASSAAPASADSGVCPSATPPTTQPSTPPGPQPPDPTPPPTPTAPPTTTDPPAVVPPSSSGGRSGGGSLEWATLTMLVALVAMRRRRSRLTLARAVPS